MTRQTPPPIGWGWFSVWMAVGAAASFTVLGAFSVFGLIALPIAVLAAWPAARYSHGTGVSGIVSGLGIPCLYVAYLNRHGPGNVCTNYVGGGQSCTQEYNPLLWVGVAAVLITTGVIIFMIQGHRDRWPLKRRPFKGPLTHTEARRP